MGWDKVFFQDSLAELPQAGDADRAARGLELWDEAARGLGDPKEAELAADLASLPAGRRLLEAVFGNSTFLGRAMLAEPAFLVKLASQGPDAVVSQVHDRLKGELAREKDRAALMRQLRIERRRIALAIGLADITGHWALEKVMKALSDFADSATSTALSHLLLAAAARGHLELADEAAPERGCGYFVLAMGKLGARELNYSSDIDLIVFYDRDKARVGSGKEASEVFVRLTRDLVQILDERTADGRVARVDLRLRPDPGAMPVAISLSAAMTYYESLGQNWERAAMIKARPSAGDLALGESFLREMRPFIWRKHLDFWAIDDIHSIKRQINAHRGSASIALPGHNVKLGRGGIREIEFFAQTQQLIYGGRDPSLRTPRTVEALAALVEASRIDASTAEELTQSYRYLRRLEHRLQMVDDQQTHSLPADQAGLTRMAAFFGYDGLSAFSEATLSAMRRVETHYAELFEEAPSLSGPGNLVFTGGEPDPDTLQTLASLGYRDGEAVFNLVRSWHHGRLRATRSTRSRQLLTDLMPALLEALGKTQNPDAAIVKFNEFLAGLPAGVQLFSLLSANPELLTLIAEIMGSAPALAEILSRRPLLLDAVLTPGFFGPRPAKQALRRTWVEALQQARDFQEVLDFSRSWTNDAKFQIGVNLLRQTIGVDEAGRALSDIADIVLEGLAGQVDATFAEPHGRVPGAGMAIVALGKYGGREMTPTSDLDLVFVYDPPGEDALSDGRKPLEPSLYYGRLAQRYISALTAPTGEGKLYDVDMRLRPSGNKGPIASSLTGLKRYYEQDAWTWELMALTRARVVVGEADFTKRIDQTIRELLTAPRDPETLLREVASMRARIDKEFPAKSLWDLKYMRGGLIDLDFLAQYLQLRHAPEQPDVLSSSTQSAFEKLRAADILSREQGDLLIDAALLLRRLHMVLRLTAGDSLDEETAPDGLKSLLAVACGAESFFDLKQRLGDMTGRAYEVFQEIVERPAEAAGPAGEDAEQAAKAQTGWT